MNREQAGWGFPNGSRKAHYFEDVTSLCGKWGFYFGPREADEGASPDDCAECRRRLARKRGSAT